MTQPLSDAEREEALELARHWADYAPGTLDEQRRAAMSVTVSHLSTLARALLDAHKRLAQVEKERDEVDPWKLWYETHQSALRERNMWKTRAEAAEQRLARVEKERDAVLAENYRLAKWQKNRIAEAVQAAEQRISNAMEALDELEKAGSDPAPLRVVRFALSQTAASETLTEPFPDASCDESSPLFSQGGVAE